MAKIKIPDNYDTLKIIRAFNERLRQARKAFGETSFIVTSMIAKAKTVLALKWSKSGKTISKSKENIAAINSDYLRNDVIKFIQQNSAQDVINNLVSDEKMAELSKMPKAQREAEIRSQTNRLGHMNSLLNQIWNELYTVFEWDADSCNRVYDELKTGNHIRELERYMSGELNAEELGYMVLGVNVEAWTPEDLEKEAGNNESED